MNLTIVQKRLLQKIELAGGQYSIGATPPAEALRRRGFIDRVTRDSVELTDIGRALLSRLHAERAKP